MRTAASIARFRARRAPSRPDPCAVGLGLRCHVGRSGAMGTGSDVAADAMISGDVAAAAAAAPPKKERHIVTWTPQVDFFNPVMLL